MTIDKFEIDSYGGVKVSVYDNRGCHVTHEYYTVPKSIIIKLISAKKAPELSDVDSWMRDYKAKNHCSGSDFWADSN